MVASPCSWYPGRHVKLRVSPAWKKAFSELWMAVEGAPGLPQGSYLSAGEQHGVKKKIDLVNKNPVRRIHKNDPFPDE